MKKIPKLTALILALILLCSACGSNGESAPTPSTQPNIEEPERGPITEADIPQDNLGYEIGKTIPNFEITTYDGAWTTLYSALAEKDLVLINIWATWCSPCGMEFPYMEEAYQQYKDSVEIFALSCEASDSDEKLANYAEANGMSFPVGRDETGLAASFMAYSIPTTVVVDRYGTICAIEVGAKTSTEAFTALFEQYLGENYAGYAPTEEAAPVCEVEPSTEEELAAALNAEGGSIVFHNIDSEHIWPFLVTTNGGPAVAVSSNAGLDSTVAAVAADIEAEVGDVVRIDFSLSCEEGGDLMSIYLDGALIKSFGGVKDYMSYAFTIAEAGEHQLIISYGKDSYGSGGEDSLRLYGVSLLSGAEAEAALKANPVYTTGSETSFRPTNPGAREIIFDDPRQTLLNEEAADIFSFWIVPGGEANMLLTLDEGGDPERLLFFSDYDASYVPALGSMDAEGYHFKTPVDSMDTSGFPYTAVYVQDTALPALFRAAICFADESNLESFLSQLVDAEGKRLVDWAYADGSEKQAPAEVSYTVRYTDRNGNAVPGVVLQVCDDSICRVYTSDEKGECTFTLPPYAYELHTLILPEGYEGDTGSVTLAPAEGGEVKFVLTKK